MATRGLRASETPGESGSLGVRECRSLEVWECRSPKTMNCNFAALCLCENRFNLILLLSISLWESVFVCSVLLRCVCVGQCATECLLSVCVWVCVVLSESVVLCSLSPLCLCLCYVFTFFYVFIIVLRVYNIHLCLRFNRIVHKKKSYVLRLMCNLFLSLCIALWESVFVCS